MKKLIAASVLGGLVTICLAASPSAVTPTRADNSTATPTATATVQPTPAVTPTPAPPFQGTKKLNVVLYVDTVQGGGGKPAPAVGCSQTNLFRQGQVVVFRMWGINVKAGGTALTAKNVTSAQVVIPGQDTPLKMTYGSHGTSSFWSAPWFTKTTTPIGVVDFTVVVKTKADKKHHLKSYTAQFTQRGFATPSRLTITP